MDDQKIEEIHDKVTILYDRLYGQDGHEGDIPEIKKGLNHIADRSQKNKTEIAKMKAYIAGAAAAAVGGIATGMRAIFG